MLPFGSLEEGDAILVADSFATFAKAIGQMMFDQPASSRMLGSLLSWRVAESLSVIAKAQVT